MAIRNATYHAAYRKPDWGLYRDIDLGVDDDPYLWTLRALDEDCPEAGVCLAFNAGKIEIEVTITLTNLLLMAKAVVEEQGHELFYGVDTSEAVFGKGEK